MTVDVSSTSPAMGLDLNSLLTSTIAGKNMGNIFGGDNTGSGMIGGLILGSLLRNNGNLLGGNADGVAGGAMLRTPPEQATANMSLMAGIGDLKQAVAVNGANAETSNATQTGQLNSAILQSTTANQIAVGGVKDVIGTNSMMFMQTLSGISSEIMSTANSLAQVVNNDGEKTRALIQSIETANLNRQIVIAENKITELTHERSITSAGVNVTNNINQNQLQQQQQQQAFTTNGLLQQLIAEQRVTQGVLNIGSGTVSGNSQTAANTKVS